MLPISSRSCWMSSLTLAFAVGLSGCGGEEVKYKPRPAVSGVKANLPAVPNVPQKPIKQGDAYTVWGASYYLRSRVHQKEVSGKKISLTGYIVKTNLSEAPECAVHRGGKADPEGCRAPVPTFWVGEKKDSRPEESIRVLGWASNFAQIYDAIAEYDKKGDEAEYLDTFWGKALPNPLPNVGAKVTVTGTYGTTFSGSSAGAEADPIMGVMSYESIKYDEPPAELATLPGVDRKPRKGT